MTAFDRLSPERLQVFLASEYMEQCERVKPVGEKLGYSVGQHTRHVITVALLPRAGLLWAIQGNMNCNEIADHFGVSAETAGKRAQQVMFIQDDL